MTLCTAEPIPNQPPHSWLCDCIECARHRKLYRIEHKYGQRRLLDAEPCRAHLAWLHAEGIGQTTLSQALGLSSLTLSRISLGHSRKVRAETARRILAFEPVDMADIANLATVSATATRLRMQAITALGYTQEWMCLHTGRLRPGFEIAERITRHRMLSVLDMASNVGDRPGPSPSAASRARIKGWRPPADFDEDLFYSPAWDGTEQSLPQAMSVRHAHVENYDFLHEQGLDVDAVAQRIGVTRDYLTDLLSRRERGVAPFVVSLTDSA